MTVQTFLHTIDGISTWVGKAAAWLIIGLMTVVCVEVFKRYILNAPTAWIFDLDIALYVIFFFPGIAALIYAGYDYAAISWRIAEHSNVTAEGPPVYQFKTVIPIAGVLVMLQGIAELVRCVVCLKTGEWPSRLHDVAEIDVVEEQLAHSEYVDEESRKIAIERAHEIDEAARQRGMGGDLNT